LSDVFREVIPGEVFYETAQFRNAVVQMLRAFERQRKSFNDDRSPHSMPVVKPEPIIILNGSGAVIKQYGIVGIGDPVNTPSETLDEFLYRRTFSSAAPNDTERFAVLLESAPSSELAKAVDSDIIQCRVSITDAAHDYAKPADGNYLNLVSSSTANRATILWRDDVPAAAREDSATLHVETTSPSSGDGSDGDYWQDTTGEKWYGPKASGAWGSAHDYGIGIVWTVVHLDMNNVGGITSINGSTTAAQQIAVGDAGSDLNIATTAAAYDNAKTYSKGWVVLSSGSTYRFINATPSAGHSPPNATYWEDVTGQGLTAINVPRIRTINNDSTAAQQIAIGDAGLYPNITTTAAAYDSTKIYSKGWMVLSGGYTYRWINASPSYGHAPPDATYWEDVSNQALTILNQPTNDIVLGNTGNDINIANTAQAWSSTQQYQPGWAVVYSAVTYRALLASLNVTPAGNPTYWAVETSATITSINLPDASSTVRGSVTVGNQTLGSTGTTKTFAGAVTVTQAGLFLSTTEFRNTASFLGQAYASNPDIYCHWISGGYAKIEFSEATTDGDPNIITLTAPFGHNSGSGHSQAQFIVQSSGSIGQSGMVFDASVLWSDVSTTWTLTNAYTAETSYVDHGGSRYKCIQSNTASSTNEPGTGTDQADYWAPVTGTDHPQVYVTPIINVRDNDGTLAVGRTGTFAGLDFVSGFLTGGTFLVPVKSGGTGRTTLDSGQLLAGAGTSAVDSLSSTRVVGETIELKIGSDSWIAFSEGSF